MFLKSWVEMGGFELNHHWHGINVLSIFECCLLAGCLCALLTLLARYVRKSRRLTALALAGTMLFATAAYAANTALSALTASGALAGANLIYVVQTVGVGGVKATMTQVATFINSLFSGDFTCASGGACTLKNTGPGATGPIGSTTTSPSVTVDAQGRVIGLTSNNIAFPAGVTSVASSCGIAGGTITSTGTLSRSEVVNSQTGTTYTYLSADCGKLITHSNAASIAGSLPQATGSFASGFFMDVQNKGAGTLTITPTTSTINGAATLALTTGQGVRIVSDGANYQIQSGIGGSGAVSSVTAGCGLTVSPTTGAVIASASVTARNNTATSDTLVTGDCGTVVTESNASAVAVGIAQAGTTGFASGTYFTVKNKGAGLVTITPTTSTIDGAATFTLTQNQSIDFYSDGANYITLRGPGTATIASGTAALGTSAIGAGACGTATTVSAAGVATTDRIKPSFQGDPTAVTGYLPTAMLTIVPYPTSGNVNFKQCNLTGSSITPSALTINWDVQR